MWIKICGNTSLADAQHAADCGADAVGFVLAPSPRRISVEQVQAITPHLPRRIQRFGVFVNPSFDEVVHAVTAGGLSGVQLHVNADPGLPQRLRAYFSPDRFPGGLALLAVLPFADDLEQQSRALAQEGKAAALLIDSLSPAGSGGTGTRYDWAAARPVFARIRSAIPVVVAGGLRPENVAEAIHTLAPWGVDVVSGVEAAPGHKDPERVRDFIRNARAAFRDKANSSSGAVAQP